MPSEEGVIEEDDVWTGTMTLKFSGTPTWTEAHNFLQQVAEFIMEQGNDDDWIKRIHFGIEPFTVGEVERGSEAASDV